MIIDQLTAIASPQGTDELPIERGQLTYKITWDDLAGADISAINTALSGKQATLVSGTNIKTVNGASLLGSGNIAAIPTGGAAGKVLVKASASNYDVTWGDAGVLSVNGATGTVVLDAEDVGATAWDLLWANASPTSTFEAQTISLDLSEYDLVLLESTPNSTNATVTNRVYTWGLIGQTTVAQFALNVYDSWGGYAVFASRTIQIAQNGIIFGKGYTKGTNSQDFPTEDNRRQAPLRIWGIKGVTT